MWIIHPVLSAFLEEKHVSNACDSMQVSVVQAVRPGVRTGVIMGGNATICRVSSSLCVGVVVLF